MKSDFAGSLSLYTRTGSRKYLNGVERRRVLKAAATLAPDQRLFLLTLAFTGARLSEVLSLTYSSPQIEVGTMSIRTLKKRQTHFREVPIPKTLMMALDRNFRLKSIQRDPRRGDHRLWPWSRTTGWRVIKRVMNEAGLFGVQACPKGLRHAFGVATLGLVPRNIRQKWMGHARPETTDIYSAVCGPDEFAFADRLWRRGSGIRRYV